MGRNTHIYGHDRASFTGEVKPGHTVLKFLQEPYSVELEHATTDRYHALRAVYGDVVPRQRVLCMPDPSGALRVVIAQERIQLADPADVYERDVQRDALTAPRTAEQVGKFIELARTQIDAWMKNPKDAVLVDLAGKKNLVFSTTGELKYLDTGTFNDQRIVDPLSSTSLLFGPLAQLEMVIGKSADEIWSDPFYIEMKAFLMRRHPQLNNLFGEALKVELLKKLQVYRDVLNLGS